MDDQELERSIPDWRRPAGGNLEPWARPWKSIFNVRAAADLIGPELIVPAHDGLFTSGELSRYSTYLSDLQKYEARELAETAAD